MGWNILNKYCVYLIPEIKSNGIVHLYLVKCEHNSQKHAYLWHMLGNLKSNLDICQSSTNIPFPGLQNYESDTYARVVPGRTLHKHIDVPLNVWNSGAIWSFVIANDLLKGLPEYHGCYNLITTILKKKQKHLYTEYRIYNQG